MQINKIRSQKESIFLIKKLTRFCSIRIAHYLSRYKYVSPNYVTIFSLIAAILASLSFARGDRIFNIIGLFFFLISYLMDFVDGDLARLKNKTSEFGEWLDAITNKMSIILIHFGISIGLIQNHPDGLVWFLAFSVISNYFFRYSFSYKNLVISLKKKLNLYNNNQTEISDLKNDIMKVSLIKRFYRELFGGEPFLIYILIFASIFNKMFFYLLLVAIYMGIYNCLQLFFAFKNYANKR